MVLFRLQLDDIDDDDVDDGDIDDGDIDDDDIDDIVAMLQDAPIFPNARSLASSHAEHCKATIPPRPPPQIK